MKKFTRSSKGLSWKNLSKKYKKHKIVSWLIFVIIIFGLCLLARDLTMPRVAKKIINKVSLTQNIKVNKDFEAEVYFNDQPHQRIFTQKIVEAIHSATKTIDIAIYSFGLEDIRNELYAAARRGVRVTVILNDANSLQHQSLLQNMPANFNIIARGGLARGVHLFSYDMHHKFMVVDRGLASEKLISGSFNWTLRQEYYDPSYLIISTSPELADVFATEFDRLAKGDSGPNKTKNSSYNPFAAKITYRNGWLETWFGPGLSNNNARQRLLALLDSAKKEIDIMVWQLTDKDLVDKLLVTAQRGIKIKLIYDNFPARQVSSAVPYLEQAVKDQKLTNFELISDAKHNKFEASDNLPPNFDSYLHRHEVIVDDSVVWAGTNNWSTAGWYVNDENIIISNVESLVKSFKTSFDFNYKSLK